MCHIILKPRAHIKKLFHEKKKSSEIYIFLSYF